MKITLNLLDNQDLRKIVQAYIEKYIPNAIFKEDIGVNYIAVDKIKLGVSNIEIEVQLKERK